MISENGEACYVKLLLLCQLETDFMVCTSTLIQEIHRIFIIYSCTELATLSVCEFVLQVYCIRQPHQLLQFMLCVNNIAK